MTDGRSIHYLAVTAGRSAFNGLWDEGALVGDGG